MVSVIIPIYNCEKYLNRTLQSIIQQTYKNYEIILINDGSTDSSLDVCEKFAKKYERIKIYSQENKGVSSARNFGLKKVKGKYIFFMDSDDYIEKDMLKDMVKCYDEFNVQLVSSGFFSEIEGKKGIIQQDKINCEEKYYGNFDEIRKDFVILWDKHQLYNIWNKLYLREIIEKNNITFFKYNWGEDIQFNRDYILCIDSMYNKEKCYYHYIRGRKGAITDKYIPDLYERRLKEHKEFIEYFEKIEIPKNEYIEFVSRRHIERTLGCIENISRKDNKLKIKEKYKLIKKIVSDDVTKECLKYAKPNSKKMKIMLIPYKTNSILILMIIGKMLAFIKQKMPSIFNAMKNRR